MTPEQLKARAIVEVDGLKNREAQMNALIDRLGQRSNNLYECLLLGEMEDGGFMRPHIKMLGGKWICYGRGINGPSSDAPKEALHGWVRSVWLLEKEVCLP